MSQPRFDRPVPRLALAFAARFFEHDLFISYSRKDQAFVGWLRDRLAEWDYNAFIDLDVEPGAAWEQALAQAVQASVGAVVVETPASQSSQYVEAEVRRLLQPQRESGRPLVPLLLEGETIRQALAHLQYSDFRKVQWDGSQARDETLAEQKLQELANALETTAGQHHADSATPMASALTERERYAPDDQARNLAGEGEHRLPTAGERTRPKRSLGLRVLSVLLLVVILIVACVRGMVGGWEQSRYLQETSDALEQAEAALALITRLEAAIDIGGRAPTDGSVARVTQSGEHIATDEFENGRLTVRTFFDEGRSVAQDRFSYESGMVATRVRTYYLPDGHRVIDRFLQDGVLESRQIVLASGPEASTHLREAASIRVPLPQIVINPYR